MSIPLNINWQQILLHLFNFVILVGGLYVLLYKPVKSFMDKREQSYKDMDERANKALKDAEDKVTEYETLIADSDAEAERIKSDAASKAAEAAAEQLNAAKKQAEKIIEDARKKAFEERARIISGANDEIKHIALDMTKKLVFDDGKDYLQEFLTSAKHSLDEEE